MVCQLRLKLTLTALIALFAPVVYEKPQMVNHPQQYETPQIEVVLPQIMLDIAHCESGNRQFLDNGEIVSNPHSSAIGRFQIMSSLHRDTAESMGMDIDTEEGNTAYAMYLYKKNGTRDWNASRDCWSKESTMAE